MQGPYSTRPGQRRRFADFVCWAEDGVCFLVDEKFGEVSVLSCRDMRTRVRAAGDEIKVWEDKAVEDGGDPTARAYYIERAANTRKLYEVLSETLHDALEQGDPDDNNVRRRKLGDFLRGRRASLDGRKERIASIETFLNPEAMKGRGKVVFGPTTGAVSWTGGKSLEVEPPPTPPGAGGPAEST